jgi:predicted type IV restriction endonuclease
MDNLLQKVRELASQAIEYKKLNVDEPGTKSGLIEPLFREIGWNFSHISSVHPEFPVELDGVNKPADYALKIEENPCLFIEAKRINSNIKAAIKDGTEKALKEGVLWLIATNGDTIAVLKIDEKIPETERVVFQVTLSDVVNEKQALTKAANHLLLLAPENVTSDKLETLAEQQLKRTRITNAIKNTLDSKEFVKLIQGNYNKLYAGDKPDPKTLEGIVGKITVGIQKTEVVLPPDKSREPDSELIRRRQERLFKYPSKHAKSQIQKNINDKDRLWLKFIERKRMSTQEFKDHADFVSHGTGGFTAFLTHNGLASNVGYDNIRKGAIYEINEEIIPNIKAILGLT